MYSPGSPEYGALLFRWEITIITTGCLIFLITTAMLGLRIRRGKLSRRAAFWMTIVMPLFQFPASAARITYSFSESFGLTNPISSYIDLFWSPICTLFIVWLYRKHLIRSCPASELGVSKESIVCSSNLQGIAVALTAGFSTSLLLHLFVTSDQPERLIDLFTCLIALCVAGAMAEIVLIRTLHGRVSLISYSWLWYLGAWVYFVARI